LYRRTARAPQTVGGGRLAELGPGDFTVYETTRPFDWSLRAAPDRAHWELSVFTWPRSAFRLSEGRSRDLTARTFAASSGVTRVLSSLLVELATQRVALDAGQADAFADELGDLLGVVLADRASAGGAPVRRQDDLLRVVDRYIDENLADPDLGPEAIARAVLISTRQLHRLFLGREQTVTQTIRTRRLEGARREILACLTTDRSLREIARNWGFVDLAVFSRAFRQTYGVTPREYRAQQCRLSGTRGPGPGRTADVRGGARVPAVRPAAHSAEATSSTSTSVSENVGALPRSAKTVGLSAAAVADPRESRRQ